MTAAHTKKRDAKNGAPLLRKKDDKKACAFSIAWHKIKSRGKDDDTPGRYNKNKRESNRSR